MTHSATPETPPVQRTALWVKILLGISLALNLAIAGLVAGLILRGGPVLRATHGMNYAVPYAAALPREERMALMRDVRNISGLPSRREQRAHYQKMLDLLRAESFDTNAARQLMATQAETMVGAQQAAQTLWLRKMEDLSQADRLLYADALEEVLKRRGRHGKKPHKPKD